jgi:polar amino acid transport system substrate-binding protein
MRTGRRPSALALAAAALAATVLGAGALAGCSKDDGKSGPVTSASAAACAERAGTKVATRLTIATDSPSLTPWYVGPPSSGKGFESALARALAKELGFTAEQIRWVSVTQDKIVAKGRKAFDLALDQVVDRRVPAGQVDLSTPYYPIPQAIVAGPGGAADDAATLDQLRALRLSGLAGSDAATFLTGDLKPTEAVAPYNVDAEAIAQVADGTLDGLVVALPQAIRLAEGTAGQLAVVGQFPATSDAPGFAAVLGKGSPLTTCVDQALSALDRDGTLRRLRSRWVGTSVATTLPTP